MDGHVRWVLFLLWIYVVYTPTAEARGVGGSHGEGDRELYTLEGKVELLSANNTAWICQTQVLVDGGKYRGFIRTDGQFTIHGLPNGVYVVEVTHPLYEFSPARVHIFRDGRKRASKLDLIQPNQIRQIKYPLQFREIKKSRFFEERSSLKLEDIIHNPMVVTVLLPLVALFMFPNLLNQSLRNPKVQNQFRRQLSTMTGGRGDVIGMGLEEEEQAREEQAGEGSVEGDAAEEHRERKKKKNEMQGKSIFNFDLAEWLAEYFYEEKTPKHSENRPPPKSITEKTRERKMRHRLKRK
ncbi:ER membrane protein complex subunit 7-like [Pecten maximus]|uniref:ER membrane protein complex subunit 7-like n=1 Tax=Pecten maximus TaxID=6579 RepID=UPI0014582FC5|nr:ER membrane protein complex subunit 7-like [Pecten maximus]